MVSEADVLRTALEPDPRAHLRPDRPRGGLPRTVAEVMTPHPHTVREETDVAELARTFSAQSWKSLPVVRDGRLVGVVSRSDVVRALARPDEEIHHDVSRAFARDGLPGWQATVAGGRRRDQRLPDPRERDLSASLAAAVTGVRRVEHADGVERRRRPERASSVRQDLRLLSRQRPGLRRRVAGSLRRGPSPLWGARRDGEGGTCRRQRVPAGEMGHAVDVNAQADGPVVVGCDGSWHSETAVVAATHEAARRGVSLVLLAVADQRGSQPDRLSWVARHEAEAMQTALAVAKRGQWRAHHTDPSVATQVVAVAGHDAAELAGLARGAGLLVLGGHGGRGQLAFSLGSTSAELARVFRCPFLMPHDRASRVKEPLDRHPAVVVGLDDLGRAAPILAVAVAEAAVRRAELVAVHAVHSADGGRRRGAAGRLAGRACRDGAERASGTGQQARGHPGARGPGARDAGPARRPDGRRHPR